MPIHVSGILVKHARRVDTCVSLRVSVRIGGYHIRITVVSVVCHQRTVRSIRTMIHRRYDIAIQQRYTLQMRESDTSHLRFWASESEQAIRHDTAAIHRNNRERYNYEDTMCDTQCDTTRYTRQIQEDTESLIQCLIRTWIHHRYELGPFFADVSPYLAV